MVRLGEMKYDELLQSAIDSKRKIKEFRPIRIRTKWKRCGKPQCFCMDGPLNGSWGNLHGPYIFAQYVDHTTRKIRVVSLGRRSSEDDIMEARNEILEWWEYFKVSPSEKELMTDDDAFDYRWWHSVRGEDFFNFYGLRDSEDTFGRHTRYYGTQASHDAFKSYQSEFARRREALDHEWATAYGMASHIGQKKLADLLSQKYYLAD